MDLNQLSILFAVGLFIGMVLLLALGGDWVAGGRAAMSRVRVPVWAPWRERCLD